MCTSLAPFRQQREQNPNGQGNEHLHPVVWEKAHDGRSVEGQENQPDADGQRGQVHAALFAHLNADHNLRKPQCTGCHREKHDEDG